MGKDSPMVSIIMPAFNAERYIAEAIESVINQSYSNWELIIINDGSTDNTQNILKVLSDERIVLLEQKNKGVSAARNAGLDIAKGKYITFLDADDVFPKKSLEVRVTYLMQNEDIHVVGGWVRIMNSTLDFLESEKKPNYRGLFLPRLLALDEQIFSSICYMFRRKIVTSGRFDVNMKNCEDLLFLIEIAASQQVKYGSISDYIYNYRVHGKSATAIEEAWRIGYIKLIDRIGKIDKISYSKTIVIRLKIIIMLLKWHIKTKTLKNIHQLLELMI